MDPKELEDSRDADNEASLNDTGLFPFPLCPEDKPKPMNKPVKKKRKRVFRKPRAAEPPVKVPKRRPGRLLTFGGNHWGQLGLHDENMKVESPTPVPVFQNKEVKVVACGENHTLVLDTDGIVWSFGSNAGKALGRTVESLIDEVTPKPIELPSKVKQISAGVYHSAALTEDGIVYAWGCYVNRDGKRYGVDSYLPEEDDAEYCVRPWPITEHLKDEEDEMKDVRIIKIMSGDHHIVMLGDDSRLYTCGAWDSGQLGRVQSALPARRTRCLDETESGYWLPDREFHLKPCLARLGNKYDVKNVWAGGNCTYCVAGNEGQLYVCGDNSYSKLGIKLKASDERTLFIKRPSRNNAFNQGELENIRWRQVTGSREHTVALSETGQVYTIGNPAQGRLGRLNLIVNKDSNVGKEPRLVEDLKSQICIQVAAGSDSSYALTLQGGLYVWGSDPTLGVSLIPKKVPVDNDRELQRMAVGGTHVALIVKKSSNI